MEHNTKVKGKGNNTLCKNDKKKKSSKKVIKKTSQKVDEKSSELTVEEITKKINNDYDAKYIQQIEDYCLNKLNGCNSTIRKRTKIKKALQNEFDDMSETNIDKIMLTLEKYNVFYSHGAKGNYRGLKLNEIVKKQILSLKLPKKTYEIQFEKHPKQKQTDEIPDWYILNKKTKKQLIGMNQISLWGGGHQANRAGKYILHPNCGENTKLLCVVVEKTIVTNNNTKKYKIFRHGFENKTLCYVSQLCNIINTYFNL